MNLELTEDFSELKYKTVHIFAEFVDHDGTLLNIKWRGGNMHCFGEYSAVHDEGC